MTASYSVPRQGKAGPNCSIPRQEPGQEKKQPWILSTLLLPLSNKEETALLSGPMHTGRRVSKHVLLDDPLFTLASIDLISAAPLDPHLRLHLFSVRQHTCVPFHLA